MARDPDADAVYRQLAVLTRRRAVLARRLLDRLDAVATPDDDRDELKAWIAGGRRRQTLSTELASAFAERRDARISTLSQRIVASATAASAFAADYGLPQCAAVVRRR